MTGATTAEAGFSRDAHVPGIVAEFLKKSEDGDVFVEFVQNELDAGSRTTVFTFDDGEVSCAGDGMAIPEDGWVRLRKVVGAGGRRVPPKRGGIGAKNHGLRTGFRIANDIFVRSSGREVRLTLLGPEAEDGELDPGVWPIVELQGESRAGTQVRLPIRKRPLEVSGREALVLPALTPTEIEAQFREAVRIAPERFIGAMAPGVRETWTLVLRWRAEEVHLVFEAGQPRHGVYERTCSLSSDGLSTVVLRERARPFVVGPSSEWLGRTPDFFVRDGLAMGEIVWRVDPRGRPISAGGRLRYPIAYPDGPGARTGSGFSVSAPFVSDDTRYAPARGASTNEDLLKRAHAAIVEDALPALLDRHGASALRLLQDPSLPDDSRSGDLARAAFRAGAVMLEGDRGGERLARVKRRGEVTAAVSGRVGLERMDRRLAFLAKPNADLLAFSTPSFVVQALLGMRETGPYTVSWIEPKNLIDELCKERPAPAAPKVLARFARILALSQTYLDDGSLGVEQAKRLVEDGRLPVRSAGWTAWRTARWIRDEVPAVVGATQPPVIPEVLNELPLLRSGPTRIKPFDLDEHLQGADFQAAPLDARKRFFNWLAKGWSELAPSTLADLARQPIWPTAGGEYVELAQICLPASERTMEILGRHLKLPGPALRRFRGFKSGSRATLKLRRRPTSAELQAWYAERCGALAATSESERRAAAERLDDALSTLLKLPDVGAELPTAIGPHVTASQSGDLARVDVLHLETEAVQRCALRPDALLRPGWRRLYEAFDARTRPCESAVTEALVADPRLDQVFYDRLSALRGQGVQLDSLAELPLVPVRDAVRRPVDLKLRTARIAERDLWGDWREGFVPPEPTPRRTDLLIKLGVAPAELTAALSREFFLWLSAQPSAVLHDHLRQVLRHWVDIARGPQAWWARSETTLPCLPVRFGADRFRLLSSREVEKAKGKVLLPDYPALAALVAERDPGVGLVVTSLEDTQGSLLQALRSVETLRSLRTEIGPPSRVSWSSAKAADPTLLALLRRMHTGRVGDQLPKNLELHETSADDLRHSWRAALARIAAVKTVVGLQADFVLRRKVYTLPVKAAVDPATETLLIDATIDPIRGVYEGVAQHVFRQPTSLSWAALQAAVESEGAAFRYDGPRGGAPTNESVAEDDGDGSDPHKAGHHGRRAKDDLPDPSPFSSQEIDPGGPKRERRTPPRRRPAGSPAPGPRDTLAEAEEKRALREQHYSHHCQACLGRFQPGRAAPEGSYLSRAAYRAEVLQAHHVDHLQNKVVLGASNLLLLCEFHHHELGDLLTGEAVRAALRAAEPASRRFAVGDRSKTVIGRLARPKADTTEGTVPIWFTQEHADVWLERARTLRTE